MWINKRYETSDSLHWLREFVDENTLSTIISHTPVLAAHMPVELFEDAESLKLLFHLPRVDPVSSALIEDPLVTVVVHGPQQYISPSLYKDVGLPTFNYGVAEVTDRCRQLSEEELSEHLRRLMTQREALFATRTGGVPWKMDEAAQQRFNGLLSAVSGFALDLDQAQTKLKMGQNRTEEDRRWTMDRLRSTEGVNKTVISIMEQLS